MFSINRVIIEEDKLQHNIEVIKNKANSIDGKAPKIIAVLKGNAYGMGYNIVAQKLISNGIDMFAVSEVSEALEMRKLGIQNEILVLDSSNNDEEACLIVKNNLIATIDSIDELELYQKICEDKNLNLNFHLKVDTGFSRFGFLYDELLKDEFVDKLKETILKCNRLKQTGIYTHFIESYANNSNTTNEQFKRFEKVVDFLRLKGIEVGLRHVANSSAFFKYPNMYLDAVRIGSAFSGRLQIAENTGLSRVGYFESEICELRQLPNGSTIGYSGTYKLKHDAKVAIVEAGYSDGIFIKGPLDSVRIIDKMRSLKSVLNSFFTDGTRYVIINNKKVPILGRVGMKNFVVDVSNIDCHVGDKVRIDINLVLCNQKIERIMI